MQKLIRVLAAVGAFSLIAIPAVAQYPSKAIRLVGVRSFPRRPLSRRFRIAVAQATFRLRYEDSLIEIGLVKSASFD